MRAGRMVVVGETNTSNPPGEQQVAELLQKRLAPLGFETEIVSTPTPGKAHFIARPRAANSTAKQRRLATRRLVRGTYGELFNGLLRTIYVPTIVAGGFRANLLPGSAEATVSMRLLPGRRPGPAIKELEREIRDKRV